MSDFDELHDFMKDRLCTKPNLTRWGVIDDITRVTSFLNAIYEDVPFTTRVHCIKKGIDCVDKIPDCFCGKKVALKKPKFDFGMGCCKEHSLEINKKNREKTTYERTGYKHHTQSPEGRNKLKESAKNIDWDARYKKTKETCIGKYGVENPSQCEDVKEKKKETFLKNWNEDNIFKTEVFKEQHKENNMKVWGCAFFTQTDEMKEKSRKTYFSRTGYLYPSQNPEARQKSIETWKTNLGTDNPGKSIICQEKIKSTNMERYNRHTPELAHITDEVYDVLTNKELLEEMYRDLGTLEQVATKLGMSIAGVQRNLKRLGIERNDHYFVSSKEKELLEFVKSIYSGEVIGSYRDGLEIDIYIPDLKIGIEFNGLYWHSSYHRKRKYHQDKSLYFKEKGILIIHVWEDDWVDPIKRSIVENKIKSKMSLTSTRIGARKCTVKEVTSRDANAFYERTHIQGRCTAGTHIGLVLNDEIIACGSFKRKGGETVWDLVRFSTSLSVSGGFSKILRYFQRNYVWDEIFTFASLDYSHGDVYEKSNFEFSHITPPGMWYVKGMRRFRREQFMKHKLPSKLATFDASLSEYQNMKNNGFERLHDSGSMKYTMKRVQ